MLHRSVRLEAGAMGTPPPKPLRSGIVALSDIGHPGYQNTFEISIRNSTGLIDDTSGPDRLFFLKF